jgi:hypothetical protein
MENNGDLNALFLQISGNKQSAPSKQQATLDVNIPPISVQPTLGLRFVCDSKTVFSTEDVIKGENIKSLNEDIGLRQICANKLKDE